MPDPKLEAALLEAADKVQQQLTDTDKSKDDIEVVTGEEPTGDEPSGDEPSVDELSEDELAESRNLYKLLRDPATARSVVAALAEQTGILKDFGKGEPTHAEAREAKKDILTIFKESLGKEYEFLADRLSKAVDTILAQERESNDERLIEVQAVQVQNQVTRELEKLETETKGASKALENRMAELSKEIPVGSMDQSTYIRRLYAVAASERGGSRPTPKGSPKANADRIRSNANDAASRLKSTAVGRIEVPSGKMGLKDSVNFALQELTKGN